MMLENIPDVLTPKQVYQILPVGMNKVYKLINDGEIKSFKIGRKDIITKQNLLDFLTGERYNECTHN